VPCTSSLLQTIQNLATAASAEILDANGMNIIETDWDKPKFVGTNRDKDKVCPIQLFITQ